MVDYEKAFTVKDLLYNLLEALNEGRTKLDNRIHICVFEIAEDGNPEGTEYPLNGFSTGGDELVLDYTPEEFFDELDELEKLATEEQ